MKDSSLLFRIDVYNLAIHDVNAIGRYFAGSLGSSVVLDLDNNFYNSNSPFRWNSVALPTFVEKT